MTLNISRFQLSMHFSFSLETFQMIQYSRCKRIHRKLSIFPFSYPSYTLIYVSINYFYYSDLFLQNFVFDCSNVLLYRCNHIIFLKLSIIPIYPCLFYNVVFVVFYNWEIACKVSFMFNSYFYTKYSDSKAKFSVLLVREESQ